MDLVTPSIGLIFWMTVTFLTVLFLLKKFAWKPILTALSERQTSIDTALQSAEKAKVEMQQMQANNESLLVQARQERENILREARELKDKIVSDAKTTADEEGKKMIAKAIDEISKQKVAAIAELKNQVAAFSLEIAEKIIVKKLDNSGEQQQLINEHLKGMDFQKGSSAKA